MIRTCKRCSCREAHVGMLLKEQRQKIMKQYEGDMKTIMMMMIITIIMMMMMMIIIILSLGFFICSPVFVVVVVVVVGGVVVCGGRHRCFCVVLVYGCPCYCFVGRISWSRAWGFAAGRRFLDPSHRTAFREREPFVSEQRGSVSLFFKELYYEIYLMMNLLSSLLFVAYVEVVRASWSPPGIHHRGSFRAEE